MADANSYQPDLEDDKTLDSANSNKESVKPETSDEHQALIKKKSSLPPELISTRHTINKYGQRVKNVARPKYLFAVVLLILSLAIGFLGGWIGSSNQQNSDNNQSVFNSKQTVVSSQSQAISAVAQSGPDPIFEKPSPLTMAELEQLTIDGVRAIEVKDYAFPGYQGAFRPSPPHADLNPQKAVIISWGRGAQKFVFSHEASYCPWMQMTN